MNVFHVGPCRLEFDSGETALVVIEGLMRHLNNKELGGLLGISERTVRRWKCSGRLPNKDNEQVSLLELLLHLAGCPGPEQQLASQRALQAMRR